MRRLLIHTVGVLTAVWGAGLVLTLLLAHLLPPSPQISFAFVAGGGRTGIQLFDLGHRVPVLIADTTSPVQSNIIQPPAYTWSPDGQQIVYEDRSFGTPRLMRRRIPDAAELLADEEGGCSHPAWSVRDQIAYLCGWTLYLVDAQNAHQQAVADPSLESIALQQMPFYSELLWSADAQQLAHLSIAAQVRLSIISNEGVVRVDQRIEPPATINRLFDWSADRILTYSTNQNWKPHFREASGTHISEPLPLVDHLVEYENGEVVLDFAWSPNDRLAAMIRSGRPWSLMITDGQLQERVKRFNFTTQIAMELVWSADSRSVYVIRLISGNQYEIARIDVETGMLEPVTPVFDLAMANLQWRPDDG